MAEDIVDITVTNYNDSVTLDIQPNVTVINISNLTGLSGIIIPSGTVGKLPYYDTTSTFADSNIFTNGSTVGINNDTPTLYSTNKGMVIRNHSGNVELLLQHDGNTAASIQGLSISTVKTDAAYIFQRENLPLKIGTNDTARILINAGGNISINNNNNTYKLDVTGTGRFTEGVNLATSSGSVGIGTSSPVRVLDVQSTLAAIAATSTTGTNTCYFQANNTGGTLNMGIDSSTGGSLFGAGGYTAGIWHSGNYPLTFGTNNSERIRIAPNGNFYIGKTSGSSKFGINGLPTSSSGLSSGDVWNDSGTLKIV